MVRLDTYLAKREGVPRSLVQKLIKTGVAMVNGEVVTRPARSISEADNAVFQPPPAPDEGEWLARFSQYVIYIDDNVIVVNKPAGMLVHAKGGVAKELTVADYVRSQFDPDELASNAGNNRLGIVHRLDRTTSGVMICARNLTTASYLSRQFAERKVKKVYLALVSSLPGHSAARINLPIRRSRRTPSTFVVDSNGKVAITDYTVQKEYPDGRALLELRPLTGRTHQLRVHLAYLGCPIVGDAVYGHARYGDRLMLHAYQLEISIPGQDGAERRIFTAPLPADFREAIGD
jgi:pseudouridine synthase, rluA family